jgi:hypothetical protein
MTLDQIKIKEMDLFNTNLNYVDIDYWEAGNNPEYQRLKKNINGWNIFQINTVDCIHLLLM